MYPTLGMDLLNGLKLAFTNSENFDSLPTFIIENIGVAADDEVLKNAEKMILQENVDLTIAFCGVHKLKELAAFHNNYQRPLIHLDIGGRVYRNEHCNPYVLHHTMNLWQSSYAAGKYAADTLGKKAIVAASFYDGAYHMMEAFTRGFTSEGGEILRYYVGTVDYKSETFESLLNVIEKEKPDFIFGIFSFKEGNKVMDVLANSKYNGHLPILAIPTMTDETIATEDFNIKQVQSVAAWSFDDTNPAMQGFASDYQATYDRFPNIIGLLGFEAGLTTSECITSEGKIQAKLKEAVQGKTFHTPRGKIHYNRFNESQIDSYKVRSFDFNKVRYHNNLIDSIEGSFVEELQDNLKDLPYNGWQNPYLCT
jgi:branched-chain amino acid transport system substrate-binding protein